MDTSKNEKATTPTVAKASKTKFAHAGKSITNRGGSNLATKICIGADADTKYNLVPPQCQHIYQLLQLLGGTATIEQLQEFGISERAINAKYRWVEGNDKRAPNVDYTQSVGEVFSHYKARGLTGETTNAKLTKAGVCEFFREVS